MNFGRLDPQGRGQVGGHPYSLHGGQACRRPVGLSSLRSSCPPRPSDTTQNLKTFSPRTRSGTPLREEVRVGCGPGGHVRQKGDVSQKDLFVGGGPNPGTLLVSRKGLTAPSQVLTRTHTPSQGSSWPRVLVPHWDSVLGPRMSRPTLDLTQWKRRHTTPEVQTSYPQRGQLGPTWCKSSGPLEFIREQIKPLYTYSVVNLVQIHRQVTK